MTIQSEIQNERKKVLQLLVDAHSQHKNLDNKHSIGDNSKCKICQVFLQLKEADGMLRGKLMLIQEDQNCIQDFNNLRRALGRIPDEREYKYKKEVIKRFGSWSNFLNKAQIDFK